MNAQTAAPAATEKLRSVTSIVLEYLRSNLDMRYTGRSIFEDLSEKHPQVTQSSVSAFLSALCQAGNIAVVGKERHPTTGRLSAVHQTVDLSEVVTAERASAAQGRAHNPVTLAEQLREIADRLTRTKTSLADYTTDELLKEIKSRMPS